MIEWHDLKGFEGLYKISRCPRLMKINSNGRVHVRLLCGKIPKKYVNIALRDKERNVIKMGAHRLVAMQFIENPSSHPIVNHLDEDPSNNKIENLEWCTYQHNSLYSAKRTGRKKKNKLKSTIVNDDNPFCPVDYILMVNNINKKRFYSLAEKSKSRGLPVFFKEIDGVVNVHYCTLPKGLKAKLNDTST